MQASKKSEFLSLYKEFSEDYPLTEKGKEHVAAYSKHRQQGQQNYREIEAAASRGEDITDLVLLKWIPYSDTPANREREVWIHHAPCVTGDLVKKSENNGNTVDWAETAKTIFQFVKHCNDNPVNLETACQNYETSPHSKGFQTGYLTPILNALRPDDFLLINSKSQRSTNYFTERNYSTKIADYPQINDAERQLVNSIASDMRAIWDSELRDDDQFDIFCHWLTAIKKHTLKPPKYWKISPGDGAWQWDECRDNGFIAIGFNELMDVSNLSQQEFNVRRDTVINQHPELNWKKDGGVNQVWKFSQISEGDVIVANRGLSEVVGIGTVTGSYYYLADAENHRHRLPVHWDDTTLRSVNFPKGWVKTLIPLNANRFDDILQAPTIQEGMTLMGEGNASIQQPNEAYTLIQCSKDTSIDEALLHSWVSATNRKKQAILYGPPGTGKTYLAHRLARHLLSEGDGFQEIVQFHPAYTYEDFIEGIRPKQGKNGGLDYPVVAGQFINFCEKARKRQDTCVIIIDEINRANLAQVFGELMYLMEYRDNNVTLPSGRIFNIPNNVRILGTMNTADRSIALVDHALRRRFAFLPLYPNLSGLRQFHADTSFAVDGLIQVLTDVNQSIGDRQYQLGTSFFLQASLEDDLQAIWQMEIEPYLEEYFFDQPDKVKQFRWDAIQTQLKA
jgi:hypothetical protein